MQQNEAVITCFSNGPFVFRLSLPRTPPNSPSQAYALLDDQSSPQPVSSQPTAVLADESASKAGNNPPSLPISYLFFPWNCSLPTTFHAELVLHDQADFLRSTK